MKVFLKIIIYLIIVNLFVILSAAFLVLLERKVMGSIQRRKGPNVVGFIGLLQPFADAFKLLSKEFILVRGVNSLFFIFSPIIVMSLALCS